MIYFDNISSTPINPEVLEAMTQVLKEGFGNPDEFHNAGRKASVLMEEARVSIATSLNCLPEELFFIHTEEEAIRNILSFSGINSIITTKTEPDEYLNLFQRLFSKVSFLDHNNGKVNFSDLENIKNPNSLVFLSHANREVGTLLPIKKAIENCKRSSNLLFCNLTETTGKYKIDLNKPGLDVAMGFARTFMGHQELVIFLLKNLY